MNVTDNALAPVLPLPVKVVCVPLLLFGLALSFSGSGAGLVLGLPLTLAAIGLFFLRERLTLDPAQHRYRQYLHFLGFRFGKWQPLRTDFTQLSLTPLDQKWENNLPAGGAQAFSTTSSVNLNLYKDFRTRLPIANGTYEQMLALARQLAPQLELEILDATVRPPRAIIEQKQAVY
jgi:hypothetical protein